MTRTRCQFCVRVGLVLIFVPAMAWAIIGRVWRELRHIPFYVRCDVACEWGDFKAYWRGDKP